VRKKWDVVWKNTKSLNKKLLKKMSYYNPPSCEKTNVIPIRKTLKAQKLHQ
jgi:hypothetical protein